LPAGALPAVMPRVVVPRVVEIGVFLPTVHGVVIAGDFPIGREATLSGELPAGVLPATAPPAVA
jgi:hypothetical protein